MRLCDALPISKLLSPPSCFVPHTHTLQLIFIDHKAIWMNHHHFHRFLPQPPQPANS